MRIDARNGEAYWRVWCCKRRIWMTKEYAVIWVDDLTQEIGYWSSPEAHRMGCIEAGMYGRGSPDPDTVEKCPLVSVLKRARGPAAPGLIWINVGHDVHTNEIEHYTERPRVTRIGTTRLSPAERWLIEHLRDVLGPGVIIHGGN